ncbi:MAG: hypothetical protein CSA74_01590 [Rhodobacterales bacterium]|nr:MAG: hypothetical protein CSA74_01590 [Rhodobacterales bacterium]
MKTLMPVLLTLSVVTLWPGRLAAWPEPEVLAERYGAPAEACWASAADFEARRACDGMVFEACTAGEPGGQSNQGMSACLYGANAFWDGLLNAEWARVIAQAKAVDAETRRSEPVYAVREERLRAAQRAWIGFRDAQCAFDEAVPGSGSMRLLYYPGCLGRMTFERLLDLVAIGDELEE